MYYRYEYILENVPDTHQGILTGMDIIFSQEDILKYIWPFEKYLKGPTCLMVNTISYFTQEGNQALGGAIESLCRAIEESGKASVSKIVVTDIDESKVLYRDPYQVVLIRKKIEE